MSDETSRLVALVKRLSYRTGEYTLASGKKSTFYVDLKNTTLHPEGAALIGKLFLAMIEKTGWLKRHAIQGVGGMTLGADPLATALSLAAWQKGTSWPAYIVRKDSKGHGTGRTIEGLENIPAGSAVLVLEDVVTTGGTSVQAIERLREAGLNPVGVLTVVDREQGAREAFAAVGVEMAALMTLQEVQDA